MKLTPVIEEILEKASVEQAITRGEALTLMNIDLLSPEMYALCGVANQLSRRHFNNLGEVYAQIGLDFAPCPGNCEFCSFGSEHGIVNSVIEYPAEGIARAAKICEDQGANGIYLMTTARYRFEKFLDVAQVVRQAISPDLPMVANIGDFNEDHARDLATLGFKAIYHAIRFNEGKGTKLPVQQRMRTIEAARKAGLILHFCVEPVGPEHTPEEQVDLMFLGRELGVTFSGAMRRVCVPGTRAADQGQITWWNLARTVAVCRLVMGNTVLGHCTHEPNLPAILAGANLLWAEMGPNPRDDQPDTENSRGMGVKQCQNVLIEAGYQIRTGPAITAHGTAGLVEKINSNILAN
jgi:biotin synthase